VALSVGNNAGKISAICNNEKGGKRIFLCRSQADQTQPVGFANPASLQAPLAFI